MTRTYIKDEEQLIPPSGATLLDLALAQLLLPDDQIDSKSLHLPSGLRRALRDRVIELEAVKGCAQDALNEWENQGKLKKLDKAFNALKRALGVVWL